MESASPNVRALFGSHTHCQIWQDAQSIIKRISPNYDFHFAQTTFDDVIRLFRGEYLGFQEIKTLYHDMQHTLSVFLCAVRLMHSMHLSGNHLSDDEVTMVVIASLMHDTGYAQLLDDESGTGAQYTQTHVERGIEFMEIYLAEQQFPAKFALPIKCMMLCTNPAISLTDIRFPDERTRFLGQIVSTADLAGQMADRTYLEKLLLLYLEFREAGVGGYEDMYDLLSKTKQFYSAIQKKLNIDLDGLYTRLPFHFKDMHGIGRNYYMESIEKNIAYLSKINERAPQERFGMLKRGGIVGQSAALMAQYSN